MFRRASVFAGLAVALTSTLAFAQTDPNFVSLGPTYIAGQSGGESGRVVGIQKAGNVLFAAASGGGIWRRDLSGGAWEPMGDDLDLLSIGAFAVDPNDPSQIYAGTGSMDNCVDCPPGVGLFAYARAKWQAVNLPGNPSRISAIRISPLHAGRIWVATDKGVYRTIDGGPWQSVYPSDSSTTDHDALIVTDLVLDPNDDGTVYIGTKVNGVLRTADGNADRPTWSPQPLPYSDQSISPSTPQVIRLAIAKDSPATVYAASAAAGNYPEQGCMIGVFKRAKSGEWNDMHAPDYFSDNPTPPPGGGQPTKNCQGDYDNTIAADPTNPDHVVAGGEELVDTTKSGDWSLDGSDWNFLGLITDLHPDQHALLFTETGDLFVGNDGGVSKMFKDDTWDLQGAERINRYNQGLVITQFYGGGSQVNDGAMVLGGTQDNGTNLFDKAGWSKGTNAWLTVLYGDGFNSQIDPTNSNHWYFEEYCPSIARTANKIATAAQYLNPPVNGSAFYAPFVLDPSDSAVVYYGGDQLWKFDDRLFVKGSAQTWQQLTGDAGSPPDTDPCNKGYSVITSVAASKATPTVVAYVRDQLSLYLSQGALGSHGTNFKAGWMQLSTPTPQGSPPPLMSVAIDPSDAKKIAIAMIDPQTYGANVYQGAVSDNGDVNWGSQLVSSPIRGANVVVYSPVGLLLGADNGLWRFDDVTKKWSRYGGGMPAGVSVYDVIQTESKRLIVLTHGRGAWISDAPVTR